MIYNQWYPVLESKELKQDKPLGVKRLGEKVAFFRDGNGKASCVKDLCVHRGAALSLGKVCDGHIKCPFHGIEFDSDGKCQLIPANGKSSKVPEYFKVDSYETIEKYDFIWIWWGGIREQYPEIPFFNNIGSEFSYTTLKSHWNTHYSRAIENQLDVVHLPFVHYNTIGRGNKTLVNGPLATFDEKELTIKVFNEVDIGQIPKRADELVVKENEKNGGLIFRFPNLWQNYISKKIRITVAFVPIDNDNTLFYLRYYQSIVKMPILRELFNYIGKLSSIVILNQDKRIVETQIPNRSYYGMKEKLTSGDNPIIIYRKERKRLIDETLRNK